MPIYQQRQIDVLISTLKADAFPHHHADLNRTTHVYVQPFSVDVVREPGAPVKYELWLDDNTWVDRQFQGDFDGIASFASIESLERCLKIHLPIYAGVENVKVQVTHDDIDDNLEALTNLWTNHSVDHRTDKISIGLLVIQACGWLESQGFYHIRHGDLILFIVPVLTSSETGIREVERILRWFAHYDEMGYELTNSPAVVHTIGNVYKGDWPPGYSDVGMPLLVLNRDLDGFRGDPYGFADEQSDVTVPFDQPARRNNYDQATTDGVTKAVEIEWQQKQAKQKDV